MFNNPGRQIQIIAKFVFVVLTIVLSLVGLYAAAILFPDEKYAVFIDAAVVVLAVLIAGLSTLFMYAVGTLIENVEILRKTSEAQSEVLEEIAFHLRARALKEKAAENAAAESQES